MCGLVVLLLLLHLLMVMVRVVSEQVLVVVVGRRECLVPSSGLVGIYGQRTWLLAEAEIVRIGGGSRRSVAEEAARCSIVGKFRRRHMCILRLLMLLLLMVVLMLLLLVVVVAIICVSAWRCRERCCLG